MSEINILLILTGDNNKGEYTPSDQVGKYQGLACINAQKLPVKQTRLLGTEHVSNKRRSFLKLKIKGFPRLLKIG